LGICSVVKSHNGMYYDKILIPFFVTKLMQLTLPPDFPQRRR
jgi:hypothetical protein